MEESKHLHTHAHKTQTYWPSQANNKLIWAISALCGGTKQQDQTGAAASSLRWGPRPPPYFPTPVASPSWLGEGWTPGKECQVQPAASTSDTEHVTGGGYSSGGSEGDGNMFFAIKKTISCPCVLHTMNNNSVVWHGFHGYDLPNPRPWQTSPPTSSLSL